MTTGIEYTYLGTVYNFISQNSSFRSKSRSRLQNAFTDSRVLNRRPSARNINPFTPDPVSYTRKHSTSIHHSQHPLSSHRERETKKSVEDSISGMLEERTESRDSSSNSGSKPKKLVLRDSNISRYKQEFHEEALIGQGEFSSVYKVSLFTLVVVVNVVYRLEVATGLNSRPEPGPKSSIQARGPARPDVLRPEARPGPTYSGPRPSPARRTQARARPGPARPETHKHITSSTRTILESFSK